MTRDREEILARAHEAIASAEATLAQPRSAGATWEAPASSPAVDKEAPEEPIGDERAVRWADLHPIVEALATKTGDCLREDRERIDHLEKRLALVEGLIAKAKGSTQ